MLDRFENLDVVTVNDVEYVLVPKSTLDQLQRSLIAQIKKLRELLDYSPLMTEKQWNKNQA